MWLDKRIWNDGPEDWSDYERDAMRRGVCFGKGGGSAPAPQKQQSTVNQSNLPEYVRPQFEDLLARTQTAVDEPYQAYEGQRLAGIGDTTQQGFEQLQATTQGGVPQGIQDAGTAYTNVAQGADLAQQAQFGGLSSFTDTGMASQYMNPYITNVLDAQRARLNQRFDEQQLVRDDAAVQAGAFGNSRRGVVDAIAQRELNQQMNEMEAQGLAQAFQTGADIFGQEQAQDLQNRGLNTEVFAGNQARALQQAQNRMQAAQGLVGQGQAAYDVAGDQARTLAGIGGAYDQQRQAELDMGHTDFLNQRDYERNNLNFYSGILRGVPVQPQSESTLYQAPPSQASQLLGLGTAGLGLARAWNS